MTDTITIPIHCRWDYRPDTGSWFFFTTQNAGNLLLGYAHPINNSNTRFNAHCTFGKQLSEEFESEQDAKEWIEKNVRDCFEKKKEFF